jgi:hypothetical protein
MIHHKQTDRIVLEEINDLYKKGGCLSIEQLETIRQAEKNFKEKDLQKKCKAIFEAEMLAFHREGMFVMIGNENNQRCSKMGLVAGFPDTMLLIDGHCFFVEFKRMKTGRISDNQKLTHKKISKCGFDVYIIDDYQVFEKVLNEILRKI